MTHDSLHVMCQSLQPHLCGRCYSETDIQEIIEQCMITKALQHAHSDGVTVAVLRDSTKAVMECLKKSWRPTEFERFMLIIRNGGHVTLDRNFELVPI